MTNFAIRVLAQAATVAAAFLVVPSYARAEVVGIEIVERGIFANGAPFGDVGTYERIVGRLRYAVDPANPRNERIVDLDLLPRAADGRVVFSGDFLMLKPVDLARGNHTLLYDVNNRGGLTALPLFNDGFWSNRPSDLGHAGNGFLMEQGFTLISSAWNWDVLPGDDRLQIDLPIVEERGEPVIGPVVAEIAPFQTRRVMPVAWGNSRGYPPRDWSDPADRLTVRDSPDGERREIPRHRWRFSPSPSALAGRAPIAIELDDLFEAGRLYELVYVAEKARAVGLGLAAIRDALSFFRFERSDGRGRRNPLMTGGLAEGRPDPERAIIFGASQSGRVIQHMLWEALHVDEAGRPVFDAAFIHVAGGGKGSFNHRFAQTTRHQSHWEDYGYPADVFPFTNDPQTDPMTGRSEGVLDRARDIGAVPLIFHTITSTEYWTRSASLLHTDVVGLEDIPPDDNTRIYFIAGARHNPAGSVARGPFLLCGNPLDFRPILRALLTRLESWAATGRLPPASAYPTLRNNTLGPVSLYRTYFPDLPGIVLPSGNLRPRRLYHGTRFETDRIADLQPPRVGDPFLSLVPLPDIDGIDRGGIRLPSVAIPLGTYLGWNLLPGGTGEWDRLGRWQGAFVPFAASQGDRTRTGDPRNSVGERFDDRDDYLARTRAAADRLVDRGLLLRQDLPGILHRAGRAFDVLRTRGDDDTCRSLDQR